jgi:hypothetical protein
VIPITTFRSCADVRNGTRDPLAHGWPEHMRRQPGRCGRFFARFHWVLSLGRKMRRRELARIGTTAGRTIRAVLIILVGLAWEFSAEIRTFIGQFIGQKLQAWLAEHISQIGPLALIGGGIFWITFCTPGQRCTVGFGPVLSPSSISRKRTHPSGAVTCVTITLSSETAPRTGRFPM